MGILALARKFGARLVTEDGKLRAAAPDCTSIGGRRSVAGIEVTTEIIAAVKSSRSDVVAPRERRALPRHGVVAEKEKSAFVTEAPFLFNGGTAEFYRVAVATG